MPVKMLSRCVLLMFLPLFPVIWRVGEDSAAGEVRKAMLVAGRPFACGSQRSSIRSPRRAAGPVPLRGKLAGQYFCITAMCCLQRALSAEHSVLPNPFASPKLNPAPLHTERGPEYVLR